MNVLETAGLSRRYGSKWALQECTLSIPEGCLVALIGPNGAGKTTLLNLVVGLTVPTTGRINVLGGQPAGSPGALDAIGFVAQDMPLYRSLSVADMVHTTRNLNRLFDVDYAYRRLADLDISKKTRTGKLSGGQRAQLALTLALARHPRLLVLDEPTASLDPLARHDFMATVMAAMADDGISVVLSSHLLAELERVADHLVLIARGRVRVDGSVDELLAGHRLVGGPDGPSGLEWGWEVVETTGAGATQQRLVRLPLSSVPPPGSRAVGIEEVALADLRESAKPQIDRRIGALA